MSSNAECKDVGSSVSLKCSGGQVELGEGSNGRWREEKRVSRAEAWKASYPLVSRH